MKVIWGIFILFFLFSPISYGGDTPCEATYVDVKGGTKFFDNGFASDSGIFPPPGGRYSNADTWLKFTMPDRDLLSLVIAAGSMENPAIAIYKGDCGDPKLLYVVTDQNCEDDDPENDNFPAILFDELVPGDDYFIRIWNEEGTANGIFSVSFDPEVSIPVFLTTGDAFYVGDCIQLTAEKNNQYGCAWFDQTIDFSKPFTSVMKANFGDKQYDVLGNDTGADGICLVYQSNGPDICGGAGGGIGAQGMPNSLIIEFDTWQNITSHDPVEDHASVNIGGNMNHDWSLAGPVSLGDIEDGVFHQIEFSWEPVSMTYKVRFDDKEILTGVFDFVGDVFGGKTEIWWGYTSATGGSNNKQVICPVIPDPLDVGFQHFEEDTICEGESFYGYDKTGFYSFFTSGNPCDRQVNVDLTVIPKPKVQLFSDSIISYVLGEDYQIITEIENDGQNIRSISWEPDSLLSCTDCLNPVFNSDCPVDIDYNLTVTNTSGCNAHARVSVRFDDKLNPVSVYVPDIINPKSDINNVFSVFGKPSKLISKVKLLQIFDRWGNKVFENENFEINDRSSGWAGRIDNHLCIPGVYVYYLEIEVVGKSIKKQGDFTVIW